MPLWITFFALFFESGRIKTEEIKMNFKNVIKETLDKMLLIILSSGPPPRPTPAPV